MPDKLSRRSFLLASAGALASLVGCNVPRMSTATEADEARSEYRAPPLDPDQVEGKVVKSEEEWRALLKDVDCCVEPVLLLDEVLEEPHFIERGLWAEVPVKDGKSVRVPRMPFVFDGKVVHGADTPGPRQGADTADFLKESGLSEDEIEALKKAGAVS